MRTYAPRGQTPIVRVPLTRDHVSTIGALSEHGHLLVRMQRWAYRSQAVVRFLKHLLQHIPGKILVIWEICRSRIIKAFLVCGGAQRLQVERIPAYAPELNPVEYIWRYLKHVAVRNVYCDTLEELLYELQLVVASLRHKRTVLVRWPKHCGDKL